MERLYLILDKDGGALAQAILESPRITEVVQLRLTEETDLDFLQIGDIQCIGLDNSSASLRGTVTMQRGERLVVRPTAALGEEARENLRIQTDFQSVMYPVTGYWKGQKAIKGHDLSCGGVAFHTGQALRVGEVVQIVLPVTDSPLLLRARILRQLNTDEPLPLYAARFVEMCLDEEFAIRKAVFSIQVNKPRPKNRENAG
ncbi:MAG: PilZ domain-containing protein [Oscillospiraceae bacterium]|nr:PilZ domain-containing protein [Oscillospiraceae bacterium]